jgi:Flp pilus assembly protein TadB
MKPTLLKKLKIATGTIGFSILVVALLGVSIIAIPVLAVIFVVFMTYLVVRVLNEEVDDKFD